MSNVNFGFEQAGSGKGNTLIANGRKLVSAISFDISPGAANQVLINVNFNDGKGVRIAESWLSTCFFASTSSGDGLITFTPDGAAGYVSGGGLEFDPMITKKVFYGLSTGAGVAGFELTETGKQGFYMAAFNPSNGQCFVSRLISSVDYG